MTKRQRQKWTAAEAEALKSGVSNLRVANWNNIFKECRFNSTRNRTNVDLKDKWRNIQNYASSSSIAVAPKETQNNSCVDDSPTKAKCNFQECNAMIFEALTSLKDPRGSDVSAIVDFIEQRHVVLENFRELLVSKLMKLVREERVEKAGRLYKIKDDTPTPEQNDVSPRPMLMTSREPVDSAAEMAVLLIAEAENTDLRAAEATEEYERVSQMAEDAEAMFKLAADLFEHCNLSLVRLYPILLIIFCLKIHQESKCSCSLHTS